MATRSGGTERVRRRYDAMAERYDRSIAPFERMLFGGGREWACSQARGEVLEIAAGTGRNLPFYPEEVRLTGIELSPRMLDVARRRAEELGREADLRLGDAQDLPFGSASFDTVVCTLGLCTISPTTGGRSPRPRACYAPAGASCCWSTSGAPSCPCASCKRS